MGLQLRKVSADVDLDSMSEGDLIEIELGDPTKEYTRAPFQVEDLNYLVDRTKTVKASANWSEMGVYKTSTGLWLIEEMLKHKPDAKILIITTKTGKITYYQLTPAISKPRDVFNVSMGAIPTNAIAPGVYLAHYHIFRKNNPVNLRLQEIEWDFVLLDEAHRIKNKYTGWTREIKRLKATYKHVMTGHGFINAPSEIWSLLHFLEPSNFRSFHNFRMQYCEMDTYGGYYKEHGLLPWMREPFQKMVFDRGPRRTKKEVFKDMPGRQYTRIDVELNATQRKMYNDLYQELVAMDDMGNELPAPNQLALMTRCRQIAVATPRIISDEFDTWTQKRKIKVELVEPSSKLDACMEILEGASNPCVVFSQFRDPINLLKQRLSKAGISHIHMQQSDSDEERWRKVERFQKGDISVFLSTMALGAESITLTAADTIIMLDRSWSPKDNDQAIARVHRPGQERSVQVINIEAVDTLDSYVEERVLQKGQWFKQIFGG